jgi:hypothetical protein
MAPGGNHKIVKDHLTPPPDHARQFKEMLCIAKNLPPGETPPPSKKLVLQWYYMAYHQADRFQYVKSGKKLSAKTIETLTAYFQLLFLQQKLNGMLERAKVDWLHNRTKRTLASNLLEKHKARQTSHAHPESHKHGG